jgi:hypothetical protein
MVASMARVPFLLVLGSMLAALFSGCATGEPGDSCWHDDQCSSQSCTFGTCDSSLLTLLADLFQETEQPSYSAPEPPPPVSCAGLDELTCWTTRGCYVSSICIPDFECLYDLDESGMVDLSCITCYGQGCGPPCEHILTCERL